MRPSLILKPMEINNDSTGRIYDMVRETVESFNIYVADFFESVAILEEQQAKASASGNKAAAADAKEKIEYMKRRIDELRDAMKKISAEMHTLVEMTEKAI